MSQLLANFTNPQKGYGEVSFYWWLGDKLTKERLTWQLEKLKDKYIEGLQINYAHSDKGGYTYGLTMKSDPPLFSEQWWELFNWFLQEAKKRGIAVSLSDYSLCTPGQGYITDEVIKNNPGIEGKVLRFEKIMIDDVLLNDESVSEIYEKSKNENILCMMGYKYKNESIIGNSQINLLEAISKENFSNFVISEGKWIVLCVYAEQKIPSVDFMNPITGKEVIEAFFQKFENRNPGEGGKGLNYFFSDEINFNINGNMWNEYFPDEFMKRKGYDIIPYLPAIYEDIGPITQKVRLDYKDVIVQLEEENYFKPVFEWHEERNMTYGCDHGGRGKDVTEFGDYFRTQQMEIQT